jgi:hypothetical protein
MFICLVSAGIGMPAAAPKAPTSPVLRAVSKPIATTGPATVHGRSSRT